MDRYGSVVGVSLSGECGLPHLDPTLEQFIVWLFRRLPVSYAALPGLCVAWEDLKP